MARIDKKVTTITFKDGSATPKTLEIKLGDNDFSWTENTNLEYLLERGKLDKVRAGDEAPLEVSFGFIWEYYQGTSGSAGVPTPIDVLKHQNAAASWVSTTSDQCEPFSIDIELVNAPVPTTCGDKETILLQDFRVESLAYSLNSAAVTVSGKCNVTSASSTRVAQ